MGRSKAYHTMLHEPSGRECYCGNIITYDELQHFYEHQECFRCTHQQEKDD